MVIKLFDVVLAEGNPEELAFYTAMFFSGMKTLQDIQNEQGLNKDMNELFKSIDESLKRKEGNGQ